MIAGRISQDEEGEEEDTGDTRKGRAGGEDINKEFGGVGNGRQRVALWNADGKVEDAYKLGKEEYALSQMALAWWSGAIKTSTNFSIMRDKVPGVNLESRVPVPQ